MRNLKLLVAFLLGFTMMMNSEQSIAASSANKTTNASHKNGIILLNAAKPDFTITLARNATTGYAWLLENPEVYKFIEVVSYKYESGNSKLVGSGGQDVWNFRVRPDYLKAPMVFHLNFVYMQPWELKVAQKQVFNVVSTPS